MSNNNSQKNVIYGQTTLNTLPYPDPLAVRYVNDTTITAARLNNTFNQLVDNDKVIEYQLAHMSSYNAGPKTYDERAIYAGEDGYKTWKNDDDDQLSILRKVDRPLQDSIVRVDGISCEARCVVRAAEKVFAGTTCGLFVSDDGKDFQLSSPAGFYAAYSDSYWTFFAGSEGVYQLNSENYDVETESGTVVRTRYFLSRRDRTGLKDCRSIYVRNDSGKMYVGTTDGIYVGKMTKNYLCADMEFEKLDILKDEQLVTAQVNKVQQIAQNSEITDDTCDLVIATSRGLYQSRERDGVIGKQTILDGTDVRLVVVFAGKPYAVTAQSLYDITAGEHVFSAPDAKCCTKNDIALFVGCRGKIVRYSPYASTGKIIEIPIQGYMSAIVEQLFVVRPADEKLNVHELLVGRLSNGKMFTVRTSDNVVQTEYDGFDDIRLLYADRQNKLYVVDRAYPDILSVFDVSNVYTKMSDSYGELSSYMLNDVDILTYTKPYSEDMYVDKMVYASSNKIIDQSLERSATGTNITAFKPMTKPDSNAAFAAIDSGKLKVLTRQLTVAGRQPVAQDVTDTERLIVIQDGDEIKFAQKSDLYGEYTDIAVDFPATPDCLESDGHNVYFLVSGIMSSAAETPNLVQSDALSGHIIYDIRSNEALSTVVAATDRGIEFHQLSDIGQEHPLDILSVFPGTVHGCDAWNSDLVRAYTSNGISSFMLSAGPNGVISISANPEVDYAGCDVYDQDKLDVGSGFDFVATSTGLCVSHYEFKPVVSGINILSGYSFAERTYAALTPDGVDFYSGQNKIVSYGKTVAAVSQKGNPADNAPISVYFGNSSGLSAIGIKYGPDGYSYDGAVSQLTASIDVKFLNSQVELLSSGYSYVDTLVATSGAIYRIGNYSSPLCEYANIKSIDSYCSTTGTTTVKRIFVSDDGTLKECDMTSGTAVKKEYPGITGVDQVVIDEYGVCEGSTFEKNAAVFVLRGENLYRFDLETLSVGSSYGTPIMTGVRNIRENIQEPHRLEIYAKGGYEAYAIGPAGSPVRVFSSDKPLTMYQRFFGGPSEYSTHNAVYTYGQTYRVIDSRACVQLSCSMAASAISGTCNALFADGKIHLIDVLSGNNLSELNVSPAVMTGVGSFGRRDGKTYVMYKDGTYCPDIGTPAVVYDFQLYAALINRPVESTPAIRRLFGIPTNAVIFATKTGVYRTNLERAVLQLKSSLDFHGKPNRFSFIKRSGGGLFAVRDNTVSSIQNGEITEIGSYFDNVQDMISSDGVMYVMIGSVWYSIRDGREIIEPELSGYDVLDILSGMDSSGRRFGTGTDSMLVVTRTGLYVTEKTKSAVLNVFPEKRCDLGRNAESIFGSEGGKTRIVNLAVQDGSSVNYWQYGYDANDIINRELIKVNLSNGSAKLLDRSLSESRFKRVYPVNDDINSGETFAALTTDVDLYVTKGQMLTPYPDMRITSSTGLTINSVTKIGDDYNICTSEGIFVSKSRGKQQYFQYVDDDGYVFTGAVEVSRQRYLFSSCSGLFTMTNKGRPLLKSVYKNQAWSDEIMFVKKYNVGTIYDTYAYAVGNVVLTSDNAKKFDEFLILPKPECGEGVVCPDLSVWDIYAQNRNEYYFATSDGLYRTVYAYDLSNDIQKFTAADAKTVYDGMQGELSARYQGYFGKHVTQYHDPADAMVSYINDNMISVSFDDIRNAAWSSKQQNEAGTEMYVENDMVYEIQYGDETTGDLYVNASNFLTATANAKCSYIFKRYMSGMSELYVYIPTTNTYYINHVEGDPGCILYGNEIKRQNLNGFSINTFKSDMSQQYTTFEIRVDSTFLSIDTLLGIQVNGNSLPLKVYRDTSCAVAENDACLMYHSFIEPSKSLTPLTQLSVDSEGEYRFEFACFGSDAQSVKISMYDAMNGMSLNTYKVVFHANRALGSMAPQRFAACYGKKLRKCTFTWPPDNLKTFSGWTTVVDPPDNSDIMYADQEYFNRSGEAEKTDDVHLYAVWTTYQFTENDTTLMMGSTKEEFFIDSACIISDTKLGDKVVIDYGD